MIVSLRFKHGTKLRGAAIVASVGAITVAISLGHSMLMGSGHGVINLLFGGFVPRLTASWSAPSVMVHEPGFPGWPYAWWLVPVVFFVIGILAALIFRYRSSVGDDLAIVLPVVAGWHLLWIIRLADLTSLVVRTLMFDNHSLGPADELMPVPIVIQLSLHIASVAALLAISLRHRTSRRLDRRVLVLSLWVLWVFSLGFPPLL